MRGKPNDDELTSPGGRAVERRREFDEARGLSRIDSAVPAVEKARAAKKAPTVRTATDRGRIAAQKKYPPRDSTTQ